MQNNLKALWDITNVIHKDIKTICDYVLSEITRKAQSPYGFYGFMNESEDAMTIFSWSKNAMSDCKIIDKPIHFPIEDSGLWGNAVRTREPFLFNDYRQDCEHKRGLPKGHVSLSRVLAIPVISKDKVVALAAVANKAEDYNETDVKILSVFLKDVQVLIERKNLETSLKKQSRHFRNLYRKTPAMMHSIDSDENIVSVSDLWLEKMGYVRDEVIGQKLTGFLTEESATYAKEIILPAFFETGSVKDISYDFVTKSGAVIQTLLSASAEYDTDGLFVRSLAVANDVTERNKLMQEQARSTQLAALGTVAAGVAHEINNPINGVINYATLLQKHADNKDRVLDLASRITQESERIAKITAELLYYSRDNRTEKSHVNIIDIIQSSLSLVAPKIRRTNISVKTELDRNLPTIFANPQAIHQAISNLVDNAYDALRYKKESKEEPVIHISCSLAEQETPMCCIDIRDNGIGMNETVANKAREAFFTTKPANEGTGLGLSIVNDIIIKHAGNLSIESIEGEYTKIQILLPLVQNTSKPNTEERSLF